MKTQILKSIFLFCFLHFAFCIHSNAQIVYMDIIPDTTLSAFDTSTYALDMDNDSIIDFNIVLIKNPANSCAGPPCYSNGHNFSIKITPLNSNAVADTLVSYPQPLNFNQLISSGGSNWNTNSNQILRQSSFHCWFGPSCVAFNTSGQWTSTGYLGLMFNSGGQVYFGWARLQISTTGGSVIIKDYAYNSIPNQSIYAGWGNLPANISLSGNLSICLGDSTTLVASGGNSYLWNTGATTASITVSPLISITSYSVTISDTAVGYSFILYTVVFANTPVTATISQSNDSLFALGGFSFSTYQWIDCLTGWLIAGATNSIYTVVSPSGSYAVIITSGACTDTSSCINVNVGIQENISSAHFSIYPNPATNSVTIIFPTEEAGEISIVNLFGQIVFSEQINTAQIKIDVSKFPAGMYIVKWNSGGNSETKKFLVSR